MSDETTVLSAKKRERTGSRYTRRIREQGGLPAIVYGHKQDPVSVTLEAREAITHIEKGEKVYTLDIEGGVTETVLLRDLQFDYLGTNIIHCDLARVSLTERVNVTIPIELTGDAVGLKSVGNIMMRSITELELECVVTNIPDCIEVDVTELDLGDSVFAKDVVLPKETMVLLTDPETEIAHIVHQHIEETTDEAEEVDEQAGPEIITESKDDEEGGGKDG